MGTDVDDDTRQSRAHYHLITWFNYNFNNRTNLRETHRDQHPTTSTPLSSITRYFTRSPTNIVWVLHYFHLSLFTLLQYTLMLKRRMQKRNDNTDGDDGVCVCAKSRYATAQLVTIDSLQLFKHNYIVTIESRLTPLLNENVFWTEWECLSTVLFRCE